jgi:hypothetical protein
MKTKRSIVTSSAIALLCALTMVPLWWLPTGDLADTINLKTGQRGAATSEFHGLLGYRYIHTVFEHRKTRSGETHLEVIRMESGFDGLRLTLTVVIAAILSGLCIYNARRAWRLARHDTDG